MEYISEKEFRKQPMEVQQVIFEWWRPSKGDLIQKVITDFITFVRDGDNKRVLLSGYSYGIDKFKELYILLPTEGQLRQFIEDKTNSKLEIKYDELFGEGYEFYLNSTKENVEDYGSIENLGTDLLQAYWKVACKIASKEVIDNE